MGTAIEIGGADFDGATSASWHGPTKNANQKPTVAALAEYLRWWQSWQCARIGGVGLRLCATGLCGFKCPWPGCG